MCAMTSSAAVNHVLSHTSLPYLPSHTCPHPPAPLHTFPPTLSPPHLTPPHLRPDAANAAEQDTP